MNGVLERARTMLGAIELHRTAIAEQLIDATRDGAANPTAAGAAATNTARQSSLDLRLGLVRDVFVERHALEMQRQAQAALQLLFDDVGVDELFESARASSVAASGSAPGGAAVAAALDKFEQEAAQLRDSHRRHPQPPVQLPRIAVPTAAVDIPELEHRFSGPEARGLLIDLSTAYASWRDFEIIARSLSGESEDDIVKHSLDFSDFARRVAAIPRAGLRALHADAQSVLGGASASDAAGTGGHDFEEAAFTKLKLAAPEQYAAFLAALSHTLESYAHRAMPLACQAALAAARDESAADIYGEDYLKARANHARLQRRRRRRGLSVVPFDAASGAYGTWKWKAGHVTGWADQADRAHPLAAALACAEREIAQQIELVHAALERTAKHVRGARQRTAEEVRGDQEDDTRRFAEAFDAIARQPLLSVRLGRTLAPSALAAASATNDAAALAALAASNANASAYDTEDGAADGAAGQNGIVHNPKNFPVDALGNPIPVWLYKLHQLDKTFECEICGTTCQGPKAYEEHFVRPVHLEGLRRLGIPVDPATVANYRNIPRRADAIEVYRALAAQDARRRAREGDEEIEDSRGLMVATRRRMDEWHQRQL